MDDVHADSVAERRDVPIDDAASVIFDTDVERQAMSAWAGIVDEAPFARRVADVSATLPVECEREGIEKTRRRIAGCQGSAALIASSSARLIA